MSTQEQVEGTSLGTQLERLRAHAGSEGWEVVGEYADEGASGDLPLPDRPQASLLMDACANGEADVVAVYHLDRFGRDPVDTLVAERELDRAGVGFVSVGEGIDTRRRGGGDRLNLDLRAVLAGEEKRRILERTKRGLRARAGTGEWPGGPPPYGFKLEPGPTGRNRLAVDEAEATVLLHAAELIVDDGHSTWTAAATLNALGLTPRTAPRWVHNRLRKVLLSPTLGGQWTYESDEGAIPVAVPAILEPERHAALLGALRTTGTGPRRPEQEHYYLLSRGLLTGECGAPFHGIWRKDRGSRAYRCQGARPEAHPRCADRNVSADLVEGAVWAEVVALLSQPERLLRMAEDYLGLRGAEADAQTDQLSIIERRLDRLREARTTRVADALKTGLNPAVLKDAVAEIESEEASLLTHRARLEEWREHSVAEQDRLERLRALAGSARERLGDMEPPERRAVLDLLHVEVAITGWQTCEACGGRGKTKGGRGGLPCGACRAMRRVPSLRIEGVVLDHLDLGGARRPAEALGGAIPFRVESLVG